ncbi:hypothetical protein FAM09_25595 [Niastella caeni]|uniref:Uncharacterized protein n=1 Tax=Niastella caeni TaxID=2569763 RepID=A0A4S8HFB0_9BACT|nr:DUF6020 family protein [Niastella caeni]THU33525.1 hypothetical protein FAM09_25595 [Niastella caeni]
MLSPFKSLAHALASGLFAAYITLFLKYNFQLSIIPLVFAALISFAIIFYFLLYAVRKAENKLLNKRVLLLSLGIAGLLTISFSKKIIPGAEPHQLVSIKVTALGEKNDSAQSSEVWITKINNGARDLDLESIPLSGGWEIKNNSIASYSQQPGTLEISVREAEQLHIDFTRHSWSGKVKIEDGVKTSIVDLYHANTTEYYTYNSESGVISNPLTNDQKAVVAVISFLVLSICWYLFLLFACSKNGYFLLTIPLCLLIFFLPNALPLNGKDKLLLLALSICSYYLMKTPRAIDYLNSYTKTEKVIIFVITIYAGFAFIGYRLFLSEFPVSHIISKTTYFLLYCFWLLFIAFTFLYLTELCKRKATELSNVKKTLTHRSSFKIYITFLGIILACWLIYFIAFFPAVMSSDSLGQWEQATGMSKYNDWHPVFHTLFNKFFITIYKSPATIAFAQILFMAMVASGFFLFLYQKGVPLKWLLWSALLFALIPANGIMSVTLWKDVPFTAAMLWLTLVLAKIATDNSYFDRKTAYAELIPALVATALFRHNGLIVYILVVAVLLVYFFRTKKASIIVCIAVSVGLIGFYKVYISDPARVEPNPSAIKLMAPVHGIAAVRYYNGELAKETVQAMDRIIPDSIWLSHYRPCSADEYLFQTKRPFVQNLSALSTSKALLLYGNTLVHNPYLVIRDRLAGTDVLWDVYHHEYAYNARYNTELESNNSGLSAKDNKLKQALKSFLEFTVSNADILIWRSGFYNILLLLLLVCFLKQRKKYFLIFIPLIGCNLSLAISMTFQAFRYVYYIPMLFGFIWLLYLATTIAPAKVNDESTKVG